MADSRLQLITKKTGFYYSDSIPVVLTAYAIYKDVTVNQCIAQLKWKSIVNKRISSIEIRINAYNHDSLLLQTTDYVYESIDLSAGDEYGTKQAIQLKSGEVQDIEIELLSVSYADGTAWYTEETSPLYLLTDDRKIARITANFEKIIEQREREEEQQKQMDHEQRQARLKKALIFGSIAIVCLVCVIIAINVIQNTIIPNRHYTNGIKYAKENNWEMAVAEFDSIGKLDYSKDDIAYAKMSYYMLGISYQSAGGANLLKAKHCFMIAGDYEDSRTRLFEITNQINLQYKCKIDAGNSFTVGMTSGGQAKATGNSFTRTVSGVGPSDVSSWSDLVAIEAGSSFVLGLRKNGTVVGSSHYYDSQLYQISDWNNIIAVSGGGLHVLGLKADNTVVAVPISEYGNSDGQCEVSNWTGIIDISAGGDHSVGLKSDGTVIAVGDNHYGQCETNAWTDIINITAGDFYTAGLKADGTVVVACNSFGSEEYKSWTNIVDISATYGNANMLIGIKDDGTVVHCGSYRYYNESDLKKQTNAWRDVVAVTGGYNHMVALRSDGKVMGAGESSMFDLELDGWNLN